MSFLLVIAKAGYNNNNKTILKHNDLNKDCFPPIKIVSNAKPRQQESSAPHSFRPRFLCLLCPPLSTVILCKIKASCYPLYSPAHRNGENKDVQGKQASSKENNRKAALISSGKQFIT